METKSKKIFFPNLDGLRFLCFLSVFLFHSFATKQTAIAENSSYRFIKGFLVANGNLGVNFFFVLSGFLITYLLFSEKEKFHRVSIKNFYIRRVLRIWPLFYLCLIFGFLFFPYFKTIFGEVPDETAHPLFYIFFLNNIDIIRSGPPDSSTLSILWSVAVEEQFYLVWPVLIAFTPRKYTTLLFLAIIGSTFLFRLFHADDHTVLEHHTFSCISDMAVGGFFAYCSFYNKNFIPGIKNANAYLWKLLYAAVILVFLFRAEIFHLNPYTIAADRLIISVLFALVIVEQNYAGKSFYKMSHSKYLSKLGGYTYGLYCLHMLGILIASKGLAILNFNRNIYQVILLESALSLAITILLAYLSYKYYESWFLKLKEKFAIVKTQSHASAERQSDLDKCVLLNQ